MSCWIAQMKPFSEKDRGNDAVKTFQENCIEHKICGMGWNYPDTFKPKNDEKKPSKTIDNYKQDYISYERETDPKWSSSHFSAALNVYRDIKIGDYILTRLFKSNECYVGKVDEEAHYGEKDLKFDYIDQYSWIVGVEWKAIGHFSKIPNALRGIMQCRMNTIKEIPSGDPPNRLMEIMYGDSTEKIEVDSENFHLTMDSLDLEDLVALYIVHHNPHYYLVPSSCKSSEPAVEFKFVCGNESITCQVKSNQEIDVSTYTKLCKEYQRIYLFSGKGYTKLGTPDTRPKNLVIIDKADLFKTLQDNLKDKGYFYEILKDYYIWD